MIGTLSLTLGPVPRMTKPLSPGAAPIVPAAETRVEAASSFTLVRRAQDGDEVARNELCARYLPRLQRWAHGRLPKSARDARETFDLLQETFLKALQHLDTFEPRHEGAFQAYLRRTLMNKVVDAAREVKRPGAAEPLDIEEPASDPSPLEEAIGRQTLERYDAALARLREIDRLAIIMRIELECSYAEIADGLDKPSVAAAQMAVSRALVRLAREMS